MLNQRQENILLSLKKLDFLNRDQLQQLHRLGKVRNTNRVLSELSPYLQSYREEYSSIYYLSSLGREYVSSNKVRKRSMFVNHIIMRNYFYLFVGCPTDWRNEIKVKDGVDSIICDAMFNYKGKAHFLEVDSTQRMSKNAEKVKTYRAMYERGNLEAHFKYAPPLLWVTTTPHRKKRLEELCHGLPCVVYLLSDIK